MIESGAQIVTGLNMSEFLSTFDSGAKHFTFLKSLQQKLEGVTNYKTLEREVVANLIKFYKLNCAALFANINRTSTLIICAHATDSLKDGSKVRCPAPLNAFHPAGKRFIKAYFNAIEDIPTEDITIQIFGKRILTIVPLSDTRVLYLECNHDLFDLQQWEDTANTIQDQIMILYHYIKLQIETAQKQEQSRVTNVHLTREIARSEFLFEQIFSQVPFGIFRTGIEGECTYINEYMLSILGLSFEQARHDGWASALYHEDAEDIIGAWLSLRQDGIPFKKEYRLQTPEGKLTWVYGQMIPELDVDKRIIGYLGTVVDISKRRHIEEQIFMHHRQLANMERLHGMGEIVSGLTHELSQPLTVISVYAQECQNYFQQIRHENPKIADTMDKILIHARRTGEIIHRINDLFHKGTLQYSQITIATLINKVIEAIAESDFADVKFNYELNHAETVLEVDILQIEQVIINLIKNAYQAMHQIPKENSLITLGSNINDDEIIFSISDTGPGIPDVITNKIFEPFFSSKKANLGLGLAICTSIATAHNGKLELVETGPEGTTFQLTLPKKPAGANSSA